MIQKTYGIDNLVDWKAQLSVGKARVIVHFSGGAITRFGVTPAEFSTKDPLVQHVIENSQHFINGKIKLLRQVELPGSSSTTKPVKKASAPTVTDPAPTVTDPDTSDLTPDPDPEQSAPLTSVEVSCLQDAQDYLKENFQVPNRAASSYEKAKAIAAEHGVEFVGAKF